MNFKLAVKNNSELPWYHPDQGSILFLILSPYKVTKVPSWQCHLMIVRSRDGFLLLSLTFIIVINISTNYYYYYYYYYEYT